MEDVDGSSSSSKGKKFILIKRILSAIALFLFIGFLVAIATVVILHFTAPLKEEEVTSTTAAAGDCIVYI